jgi:hypothetical protein
VYATVLSWHCKCNFGDRILLSSYRVRYGVRYGAKLALQVQFWPLNWPLRPNTSHFHLQHTPLMCWRHTMLPWTTLRLGWGCISSGEGPSSGLHGNSKSDAVLDSWLVMGISWIIIAKRKQLLWAEIGAKRPNYTNRTVRWPLSCTVRDRTYQLDHLCSVRHGIIRYGTWIRSKLL